MICGDFTYLCNFFKIDSYSSHAPEATHLHILTPRKRTSVAAMGGPATTRCLQRQNKQSKEAETIDVKITQTETLHE